MANAALNSSGGSNNLRALLLTLLNPIGYVDTGEPTGTIVTTTTTIDYPFPAQIYGAHPPITRGTYVVEITNVDPATAVAFYVYCSDGTHREVVAGGAPPQGNGIVLMGTWQSSAAAGSDSGSVIAPITKMQLEVQTSGSTQLATARLVATACG